MVTTQLTLTMIRIARTARMGTGCSTFRDVLGVEFIPGEPIDLIVVGDLDFASRRMDVFARPMMLLG